MSDPPVAPGQREKEMLMVVGEARGSRSGVRRLALLLAVVLALAGLISSSAQAAAPQLLRAFGESGGGAGQFREVRGIAADPSSGHLFMVDSWGGPPKTNRIVEFTAWGEFVKAWGWGVRDGSAALQTCGPGASPPSETCLPGLEGDGAGQMFIPSGIGIDSAGDIYVFEQGNQRVQKFSREGQFILAFGGGVNATTGGDVCTAASGDECQAGAAGTGNGQFSVEAKVQLLRADYLEVGPDDHVFVGDRDRIQEFEPDGTFVRALPLPEPGNTAALTVDPVSGDLYFSYEYVQDGNKESGLQPDVYRLDSETGAILARILVPAPQAVTADAAGNLYVLKGRSSTEVIAFGPDGDPLILPGEGFYKHPVGNYAIATNTVTASGEVNVYLSTEHSSNTSFVSIFGPPPGKWPPPLAAPSITAQYASAVGTERATLKAAINPHFWADTTYHVEYGPSPCASSSCTRLPESASEPLGGGVVGDPVTTEGIDLVGLDPGTEYFFRFVAESSGGGPVVGQGPAELEGTFTTRLPQPPETNCANQEFRTGASAFLPDCRAYEMVSPVDKASGDIVVQLNIGKAAARLDLAAAEGGRMTYSAYRAFGDAKGSPYSSQYLASRQAWGWTNRALNAAQEGIPSTATLSLDTPFKAFSPNLERAWLASYHEPPLAPQAIPGYTDLYRMETGSEAYSTITSAQPQDEAENLYVVELQGVSGDGEVAVFGANAKLTSNASPKGNIQVYASTDGSVSLISIRPSGVAAQSNAYVGTPRISSFNGGREDSRYRAVSEDGSRIFWTEAAGQTRLYVRIDGEETVEISDEGREFITADPAGENALFRTANGSLVLFNVDAEQETTIANAAVGVAGFSDDLSSIFFVSTEALDGAASLGAPNLYHHQAGEAPSFVATLSERDVDLVNPNVIAAFSPIQRSSRATPDGRTLIFMSAASLTGYDTLDVNSGEPVAQVFRYDADEQDPLRCLSCNPTNARPFGRETPEYPGGPLSGFWTGAAIPGWQNQFHAPRALSEGGDRAFFESTDALVGRDQNGKIDVYQWELSGVGGCTQSSPTYFSPANGCIDLISDGGETGSAFVDASADGSEVFFTTGNSLVSQDPGLIDVYVARVGGGFPEPPASPTPCEGERCQPAIPPPPPPAPSSNAFVGPQNPPPVRPKKCGKKKRRVVKKGKARCVKIGKAKRGRGGNKVSSKGGSR